MDAFSPHFRADVITEREDERLPEPNQHISAIEQKINQPDRDVSRKLRDTPRKINLDGPKYGINWYFSPFIQYQQCNKFIFKLEKLIHIPAKMRAFQ